ncbi:tyrosine--tRNA ligase [Prochlorococcus marinus]|uniref:tyrosine--tRNA ligase n=1 Tax=Prochlorococcus marinus TaxID=1219 RepID=UPI0039B0127E
MLDNFNEFPDWLSRGLDDLFPYKKAEDSDQSFIKRLELSSIEQKPLRVKLGIDPTGTDIHIGHSILFRKLRAFQDAGHKAILIIGDFTARIGDPTGKSKTRIQLTKDEVESNALNYLEQLGLGKEPQNSLLDFSTPGRLEIRRNSEWLESLNLSKVIELLSNSTVGQMLAKEDFNNRYKSGTPISLHEFLYPLLQGYDSVAINADLELGGTDQKFNIAMGRDLQKAFGQKPQFGMLLPILVGLDGTQKMSKSLNNFVGINEDSLSMYSKLEKVPDDLVFSYLNLLTDENLNELSSSPREVQKFMALKITSNFKGVEAAKKAQSNSEKLVLGNQNSLEEIPESSISNVNFPAKAFYLFSKMKLCSSSSEARRQILGGGVRIDGEKIEDPNLEFDTPDELIGKILQVGKKKFLRVSN